MGFRSLSNNLTVNHYRCLHHPLDVAVHARDVAAEPRSFLHRSSNGDELRQCANRRKRQSKEPIVPARHLAAHRFAHGFGG